MIVRLAVMALLGLLSASAALPGHVVPLARAHAHNDYLHARPLLDALDHGFTSVEVDVWLVRGALLVAHDLREVRPDRTLRALYLEPLRRITEERGGRIFPGYPGSLQLLIDIKSDSAQTYRALHEELRRFDVVLTVGRAAGMRRGPVRAVISGNRPRELMQSEAVRYAGYDGRLADLTSAAAASFMPLVSDNWMQHFRWMGLGPMPGDERAKLHAVVERAHREGRRVRFWATPDAPGEARSAIWTELLRAGVDSINSDDLAGLRDFLLRHDPTPSTPR